MQSPTTPSSHLSDASAVTVVDDLLRQAFAAGASDLHFENAQHAYRVRFRIDGLLKTAATLPAHLRDAVVARIKVLARMDIAEKRLPQDGRFSHTHQGHPVDLRVSSLPTVLGEKLVLRVLNIQQSPPSLTDLGYEDDQLIHMHRALQSSDGMVLMTGPTGSGKTRSLYSCLHQLNRPDFNISTLEDPVEIQLPGINQVQIHERVGLSFAHALRALLRQDPDVIMLGEIRDLDTANIALQAAQTGHLVLSTLHTPNAPSALTRLQHMGVAPHLLSGSIRLVVAQRLLRRLCPLCKRALSDSEQSIALREITDTDRRVLDRLCAPPAQFYEAAGCSQCDSGYTGRIGVFQVMPVSESVQDLLLTQAHTLTLARQAASEHIPTLRQSAWRKAGQGLCDWRDVQPNTPPD